MIYKLKELADIKYGKNQSKVADINGKYPIYGTGGLMGRSREYLYNKPSVLIGRKGTIDKVRYIDVPFWTVDTLFYTIINEKIVCPKYFYYLMQNVDLLQLNEGTTIPSLRTETLNRIELDVPDKSIQTKVISLIDKIDDKIALNNKINDNLAMQVKSLYEDLIKDLDLDNLPRGYKLITLADIADVQSGKRPSTRVENADEINIYPLVGAASIMGFTNEYNFNEKILVTGRVGTHGIIQRFSTPCWASDNTLIITSNYYEFTSQVLQHIDYRSMNRGSTQPLITQSDLKKKQVVLPTLERLNEFEISASTLMAAYDQNVENNKKLTDLRDTLLPKLMSGEIDVDSIEP